MLGKRGNRGTIYFKCMMRKGLLGQGKRHWNYGERVLLGSWGGNNNEDTKSGDTHSREAVDLSECRQHLCEPISKEEISWALNVVKKDVAPGLDGVVMEMMLTERLLEVRVALLGVCWERERVPTYVERKCCACTQEVSERCV